MFFNKFINNTDDSIGNYALIRDISSGEFIDASPCFDLDYSCDVCIPRGESLLLSDGSSSILSFIEEFKREEWFKDFVKEFIRNFNMEQVLQEVQEEHQITFDPKVLEYYTNFFTQQFEQVKMAAELYFDSEEPMLRE